MIFYTIQYLILNNFAWAYKEIPLNAVNAYISGGAAQKGSGPV